MTKRIEKERRPKNFKMEDDQKIQNGRQKKIKIEDNQKDSKWKTTKKQKMEDEEKKMEDDKKIQNGRRPTKSKGKKIK